MSVLGRLASGLGRRDEKPNKELAEELARDRNRAGIREVAAGLEHGQRRVRSDCVKVLSELGLIDPALVAPHVEILLALLANRNRRLVWGAMSALSAVAGLRAATIYRRRDLVLAAMRGGSVIAMDHGVGTLAAVAAHSAAYRKTLFPILLDHLETCRSKDVPQHAEKILVALTPGYRAAFMAVLEARLPEFTAAQSARVRRVLRRAATLMH